MSGQEVIVIVALWLAASAWWRALGFASWGEALYINAIALMVILALLKG